LALAWLGRELLNGGQQVLLVEARDRIGGRILTISRPAYVDSDRPGLRSESKAPEQSFDASCDPFP